MNKLFLLPALLILLSGVTFAKDDKPVFLSTEEAGVDYQIQGEYVGTDNGVQLGAQVVALGKGKFDIYILPGGLPGEGWSGKDKLQATGSLSGEKVTFKGAFAEGSLEGETLKVDIADEAKFKLKKVNRKSPTLGAAAPEGAIVLFDGTSLDALNNGVLTEGNLLGIGKGGIRSKKIFKDFTLHLEFRTPFQPESRGQARGNSGMYLLDQYECQVLDSFGLPGYDNECGGIYKISRPRVNMAFPPLTWQTYDVEFKAARFDDTGKKTAKAVATIKHNGVVIHDKLELPNNTPGGGRNDEKEGALFLQDHGNQVVYRNIWVVEK